jgi:isopenicillin-N N-acyltransferase like protein
MQTIVGKRGKVAMEPKVLVLRGGPLERGRQHGESLRAEIRTLLAAHEAYLVELVAQRGGLVLSKEHIETGSRHYLEAADAWAPDLVEEMTGIAHGAGVELIDVVTLNSFLEWYDWTFPGLAAKLSLVGCTALALGPDYSSQGGLIAQNYDLASVFPVGGVVLDITVGNTRSLVATIPGVIGCEGLNSDGVGLVINKLTPRDAGIGIIYPIICRRVLEQHDLAQAVGQVIRPRRASGLHYLLMDGTGELLGIETTGTDFEILYGMDDRIVHTNHYLSERLRPFEEFKKSFAPDSITRYRRVSRLVGALPGAIGMADVAGLLADHHCSPTSICRHDRAVGEGSGPGNTIFSVIMEPAHGRFWFAGGPPCSNQYLPLEVT